MDDIKQEHIADHLKDKMEGMPIENRLTRGLWEHNPLSKLDDDFENQFAFCQVFFGKCYVKEEIKNG